MTDKPTIKEILFTADGIKDQPIGEATYSRSEVDAIIQAANEVAEKLIKRWRADADWCSPHARHEVMSAAREDALNRCADDLESELSLIPQSSALDRRLAEVRLEEHERYCIGCSEPNGRQWCTRGTELRRAVKGETNAK